MYGFVLQYFRQLIALSEGIPEKWNWRQYYFPEHIRATMNDLGPEMEKWNESDSKRRQSLGDWQG